MLWEACQYLLLHILGVAIHGRHLLPHLVVGGLGRRILLSLCSRMLSLSLVGHF